MSILYRHHFWPRKFEFDHVSDSSLTMLLWSKVHNVEALLVHHCFSSYNNIIIIYIIFLVQNYSFVKILEIYSLGTIIIILLLLLQWNPSKADTIGTKNFVHCSEVSLAQGLVVDHAPPTIAASYDKALLRTTKTV